jgi:hypothetical protein
MPPYTIEVTKHGKIDGACDGKNEWDVAIKGLVPQILNMVVVKVGEQNLTDMVELCSQLSKEFEYVCSGLSARGFKDCVQ